MGIQERRKREREARRAAVLDATRALLQERGFVGTTTKEIAKKCELSEAAVFWYFRSKDEIFVSLLFEGIAFAGQGIDKIAASTAGPEKKLTRLWDFFKRMRDEHPEYFQVFTYLAHPQSTAAVNDETKEELARKSGDNFRKLADLMNEIAGGKNGRLLADLVWSSFVGLMVLRDSRVNLGAKRHPNAKELNSLFKLLLSGIAPTEPDGGA